MKTNQHLGLPMARVRAHGLTLTEILVVVAILAILATVLAVNYGGVLGGAKHKIAIQEVAKLKELLEQYKIATGDYPNQTDGLSSLTKPLPGTTEPLLNSPNVLDPWHHPYVYVYLGQHGKYDLTSLGADGVEGGTGENSDIHSWDDTEPTTSASP